MQQRNDNDHSLLEWRVSELERKYSEVRDDLDENIKRDEMLLNRVLGAFISISFAASAIGYILSKF